MEPQACLQPPALRNASVVVPRSQQWVSVSAIRGSHQGLVCDRQHLVLNYTPCPKHLELIEYIFGKKQNSSIFNTPAPLLNHISLPTQAEFLLFASRMCRSMLRKANVKGDWKPSETLKYQH